MIILLGTGFALYKGINFTKEKIIIKDYYLASSVNTIPVYTYNEESKQMEESNDKIYRGTKVKSGHVKKTINEKEYIEIKLEWCYQRK